MKNASQDGPEGLPATNGPSPSASETQPTTEASPSSRTSRLRRLFQLLVLIALLWVVVTAVRMRLPPSPLAVARAAVEKGQFDAAVENYLRHLTRKPEDWNARLELGAVLAPFDRPQALVELRKIPPDAEAYLEACRQIGIICFTSERFAEAEEVLLPLAKALPQDGSVQLMLAELYFSQHRAGTALPYAQKAAELLPKQARPDFLIAEILDDLRRPAEMIPPLRKVIELQPEGYAAHLNLSYALSEAGQAEESRREARWCLTRNAADVNARRLLAKAARDLGDRDEALAEIQRALELAPNDVPCRLIEAELLLFNRQGEQALNRLKPLYEQHANDRRLVALLARAAEAAGKKEEAEEYRRQIQKLNAP